MWSLASLRVHGFSRTLQRRRDAEGGDEAADAALAERARRLVLRAPRPRSRRSSPTPLPCLDALRADYRLGLLSNGSRLPEKVGLAGYFESVVFAQDHRVAKPDKGIFEVVERALAVPGPRPACWWATIHSTTWQARNGPAGSRCGSTATARRAPRRGARTVVRCSTSCRECPTRLRHDAAPDAGAGAAVSLRRVSVGLTGLAQRVRMTTPALAPRPTVCASAVRAPSTWRGPHSPSELADELDHLAERRGAEWLTLGEQSAARVDREAAAEGGGARVEECRRAAGLAEAELLARQQLAGGVGVLALDHVEVARDRSPPPRRPRWRPGCVGAGTASSASPDSGVDSLRTEPGTCERRTAAASVTGVAVGGRVGVAGWSARRSTTAAAPSFGRAQHEEVQRLAHHPRGRGPRRPMSPSGTSRRGSSAPWRRFLTTTRARWSLVTPDRQHQPLRPQGEEGRRCGKASLLLPGLEERRADDALGHFLGAEDEDGVVLPGPDGRRSQHERGTAAGAACLHVDDGHSGHAQPAQHLVARGHPAVRRPAERGLEPALADPRLTKRGTDGHHAQVGGRDAVEPSEGVQARPRQPRPRSRRSRPERRRR